MSGKPAHARKMTSADGNSSSSAGIIVIVKVIVLVIIIIIIIIVMEIAIVLINITLLGGLRRAPSVHRRPRALARWRRQRGYGKNSKRVCPGAPLKFHHKGFRKSPRTYPFATFAGGGRPDRGAGPAAGRRRRGAGPPLAWAKHACII